MVKNWCNVLSMEGVTVCGHHPECRVTFGRGGPHIVWLIRLRVNELVVERHNQQHFSYTCDGT